MEKTLTNSIQYVEREREREFLSNNGRRKLLFNFFLNQRGGEGYLIPNISLEVLDYE